MPGFSLRQNLAFNWMAVAYRISRLLPDHNLLLERLDDGHLRLVSEQELLAGYSAGEVTTEEVEHAHVKTLGYRRPMAELSDPLRAEVKRRFAYVSAFMADGMPTFTASYLRPIIRRVADEISDSKPPSVTTVYRWVKKYRQATDATSLVPRFDRRGSRVLRQADRLLKFVAEAMEEAFKASPRAGARDIHIRLKAKLELENARCIGDERLRLPSLRTMYRMMDRADVYDMTTLRDGKAAADKRLRINKKAPAVSHILERVEVDHTPLDLFLVCDQTFLPLGRPTLTVFLDRYSRMPLGYYLSFGGPSAAAVIGGLRHAILPKDKPNEVIPGLAIEHDWPCYGIMDLLVVDNGLEFHGVDLDNVALDLGVRILYCPKHAPQFKGAIERFLKTINYFFVHQLPGTSLARLQERGDYDSAKHALLTLAEFKLVLEKWFLDVYAQSIHRGIGVTPWAKWHEGLERRSLILPSSLQSLQRRIGLVTERSLRRDGILFKGIRYSGQELVPMLRKYGEGIKVRVLYDHEDLGQIQVWSPDSDEPVSVLAADYGYAKGLTVVQNDLICAKLREEGSATEDRDARDKAKMELAQAISQLMASRKQRDRRKAAALRGLTSTAPTSASVMPSRSRKKPKPKPKPKAPRTVADGMEVMPPVLPSFQLSRNGGRLG